MKRGHEAAETVVTVALMALVVAGVVAYWWLR